VTVNHQEFVAEHFERHRKHLHTSARRMLGSDTDADDALQEAWIRINLADTSDIENPAGWLTTIVARVCLTMLRSRKNRHDLPTHDLPEEDADPVGRQVESGPEDQVVEADMVGVALLVVLEHLTPAERLAFVLHDVFDLPFDEIAPVLGRTAAAARQLASRARRRVRGAETDGAPDVARRAEVVRAFLAASRSGNFQALLELLDPEAEARSDFAAVAMGSPDNVRGATAVAQMFSGRAKAAKAAFIDGEAGAVWAHGSTVKVAFLFTVEGDRVTGIELVADADTICGFEVDLVEA
jgi:RNA polymerase sigma factor (sigma-70 family)